MNEIGYFDSGLGRAFNEKVVYLFEVDF